MRYLLDTCVLSEAIKSTPDPSVMHWLKTRKPHELFISAVTWGELQRGVARLPQSKRRSELTLWLDQLGAGFEDRILPVNQKVSEAWAQMTVHAELRGKPLAAFDSLIAATALSFKCQLVTRNVRDFVFASADLFDPWQGE